MESNDSTRFLGKLTNASRYSTESENDKSPRTNARAFVQIKSGGDLLSQGVYPQVPLARAGLTAVFGMGTGVSPPLWPPEIMCLLGFPPKTSE